MKRPVCAQTQDLILHICRAQYYGSSILHYQPIYIWIFSATWLPHSPMRALMEIFFILEYCQGSHAYFLRPPRAKDVQIFRMGDATLHRHYLYIPYHSFIFWFYPLIWHLRSFEIRTKQKKGAVNVPPQIHFRCHLALPKCHGIVAIISQTIS